MRTPWIVNDCCFIVCALYFADRKQQPFLLWNKITVKNVLIHDLCVRVVVVCVNCHSRRILSCTLTKKQNVVLVNCRGCRFWNQSLTKSRITYDCLNLRTSKIILRTNSFDYVRLFLTVILFHILYFY